MKRIACMLVVMSVAGLTLTGCNTVAGFGKDVQRAGAALQRAAR